MGTKNIFIESKIDPDACQGFLLKLTILPELAIKPRMYLFQSGVSTIFFCLISFLLIFTSPKPLLGHPHMFIDCKLTLKFDNKGLHCLQHKWHFDKMSSSMILRDFDKDGDGNLDKKEVASLKKDMFDNLKKQNYFTYIGIDKQRFEVKHIQDFNAQIINRKLVYEFTAPCRVNATNSYKKVRISIFDPTYYSQVKLSKDDLKLQGKDALEIKMQISKAPDLAYYHERVVPQAISLRIKE